MPPRQSELTVITRAKDLASYVLTVTAKSPKRFRFTLVAKLQGYALDAVEGLFRANEVYVARGDETAAARRLEFQHQALAKMRLLGYMAQLATEQGCLLPRQYEQIAKRLHDCRNLCGAWINADRRRLGVGSPQGGAGGPEGVLRVEKPTSTQDAPHADLSTRPDSASSSPQLGQQLSLFGAQPG